MSVEITKSNEQTASDRFTALRVTDGRLVEHWALMGSLSMLQQMGVVRR